MIMKNPPHPGLSVLHDCMEPLGLSIPETAHHLGVSQEELLALTKCQTRISPEMAIRLDKAFGGGAETWYGIQANWDLAQALLHAGEIVVKRYCPLDVND